MEKIYKGLYFDASKLLRWWKPPKLSKILNEAAQIHQTHSIDAAIKFLALHGQPSQIAVGFLFRANDAVDDFSWQLDINSYLEQYNIAPVKLVPGDQKRFYRLTAKLGTFVVDGPIVSIILTAYNAQDTVTYAVASILRQSWRNLELIIVDDASTDETWRRLKALEASDNRVRIFRNGANVGPYVSKNLALSLANGDYITCHDADDWAHPQRLERQMKALQTNSSAVGNVALWLRATEDLQFRKFGGSYSNETDGIAHASLISCLFRKEVFANKLGHWDSVRFGADHELFHRARKVFDKNFTVENIFSAFGLASEASLTAHPVYGTHVGPKKRLSPVRVQYKTSWEAWHKQSLPLESRIEFPLVHRSFSAPDVMLPNPKNVDKVLRQAFEGTWAPAQPPEP